MPPKIDIRPLPPTPAPGKPPAVHGPWRFSRLSSAPHRLGFFAAGALMAASALWWLAVQLLQTADPALPSWAVPPAVAHGLVFAFGFMPLFMVGFLFTAGPRWLGLPDVPAMSLRRPVLALAGGWALFLPAVHLAAPLAAAAVLLAALGWGALLWRFRRLLRASPMPDTVHARAVAWAGLVGLLAMLTAVAALVLQLHDLARAAVRVGLWGFLAPVFAVVAHRMIPFFTASALPALDAWRPWWLMAVMLATLAVEALGAAAEVLWWPLPAATSALRLLVTAPAAGLMLWLAVRWGLVQSLRVRLLAMLHAGFVWLGLALALSALSHARVLWLGPEASLGLAPLHALSVGYLGTTLLAMVTRVAAGHSGRPLAADGLAFGLYLLLQAAALGRVAAALWPAAPAALLVTAALAWAAGCTGWAWRYGGWMGRPRIDGRPG
jgi:uncharacterized protein involved in response to NO